MDGRGGREGRHATSTGPVRSDVTTARTEIDPDRVDSDRGNADQGEPDQIDHDLLDAALGASRVLVALAARSLAGAADDVTLPQFRALVVVAMQGPQRVADLATELAVNASTATRMCDRLVRKGLVTRRRLTTDRRTVVIGLSGVGRDLVAVVTERRRIEIAKIIDELPVSGRPALIDALRAFTRAAGEVPEQHWSIGWRGDAIDEPGSAPATTARPDDRPS